MKIKAFSLILIIALVLCGCNSQLSTESIALFDVSKAELNIADENTKVLLTTAQDTKSTDIGSLLTETYKEEDLFYYIDNGLIEFADQMNEKFRIECIRKTMDFLYYIVYKTTDNSYFYIYFVFSGVDKRLEYAGFYYYYKPLFYEDFQSIKEGSSIEEVVKIDVNTKIDKVVKYDVPKSDHYLADGRTLRLEYKRDRNNKLKVKKMKFINSLPSSVNMIYTEDLPGYISASPY